MKQSVANIRIHSNIRIFSAEYLIFEYEYIKIGKRIYSNIRNIKKLCYEYIRIFVYFLRIYSNIRITRKPHQIKPWPAIFIIIKIVQLSHKVILNISSFHPQNENSISLNEHMIYETLTLFSLLLISHKFLNTKLLDDMGTIFWS